MTVPTVYRDDACLQPRTGTLYDVIDIILDRGMVIDVFLRVSLVGIEIVKVDIRIVIASVDTYLRFAEVCNRIDLETDAHSRTLPDFIEGMSRGGVKHRAERKAVRGAGSKVKEAVTGKGDNGGNGGNGGSRRKSRRKDEED
ncbi:gas vesicle protein GvpJ [Streptomyces radicis]|uniref:Gas vesicle protein A n=1 Tax=Streptomyces radicis TaxID=1750517 RepID=A0A3A9W894_9ACTN|nr:gas vesicle protein GvpJ [Streptomyces radicis]RKN09365.1 gas vesicle structural protein GvpA [Streptomyces radicis]RKN23037.1 gas vesicle structural protein GvpA [Streptomyces radicis]